MSESHASRRRQGQNYSASARVHGPGTNSAFVQLTRQQLQANQTWPPPANLHAENVEQQLSWLPKDLYATDLLSKQEIDNIAQKFNKYTAINQTLEAEEKTTRDPRYKLNFSADDARDSKIAAEKQESIIKWFDRTVEKELKKRREAAIGKGTCLDPALRQMREKHKMPKGASELMAEASASRVELAADLKTGPITELSDAVDKLVKAEAMCKFAGAVKAAEAAAESAPPEMVEEAAAAGARGFQSELTSIVQESIPGAKPIEVIGYIGITRPTFPMKSD